MARVSVRIGRKPRLGLLFGACLYPRMLDLGEVPDHATPPRAGSIDLLCRACVHYDIYIYPFAPRFGRPSQIVGWLTGRAMEAFEAEGVDGAQAHALALMRHCLVVANRPGSLDRYVDEERPWPSLAELADMDEALRLLERELEAEEDERSA